MVTIETLQIINDDLDAERDGRPQIQIDKTTDRSRNFQVQDKTREFETSIKIAATTAANGDQFKDSQEPNAELADHISAFENIVYFFHLTGSLMRVRLMYFWPFWKEPMFYVANLYLWCSWISLVYTMVVHYRNEEFTRMIEPIVVLGLAVSATHKMILVLNNWNKIVAIYIFPRKINRQTADGSARSKILLKNYRRVVLVVKIYIAYTLLAFSGFLVIPVKTYILRKELISLVPMEVIFCDQSTTIGFVVANSIQSLQGMFLVWVTVQFGSTFITVICNYTTGVNLLSEDFNDLDKMWCGEVKVSITSRHAFLRNIYIKRLDLNNYLTAVDDLVRMKFIIYFMVNYFSQIIILYETFIQNWEGGYPASFFLFFEMMFYCLMGTAISISDDKMCHIICNSRWHEYDLLSQKVILILLKEAQIPKDLQLGFMGPLNMVTFVTVVKSIYSYYTVLSEML